MNIDGKLNNKKAMEIRMSLNDLTGVTSSDVAVLEARAYAYAGDKLDANAAVQRIREIGLAADVVREEYVGEWSGGA